jgi:hypothetical protein
VKKAKRTGMTCTWIFVESSLFTAKFWPSLRIPRKHLVNCPCPIRASLLKFLVTSFSSSREMVDMRLVWGLSVLLIGAGHVRWPGLLYYQLHWRKWSVRVHLHPNRSTNQLHLLKYVLWRQYPLVEEVIFYITMFKSCTLRWHLHFLDFGYNFSFFQVY